RSEISSCCGTAGRKYDIQDRQHRHGTRVVSITGRGDSFNRPQPGDEHHRSTSNVSTPSHSAAAATVWQTRTVSAVVRSSRFIAYNRAVPNTVSVSTRIARRVDAATGLTVTIA